MYWYVKQKLIASESPTGNANIRESHMNRIEVLEKVKGLLLLPNLEMATTKQVADFYEVPITTLRKMLVEHREELTSDGVQHKGYREIKALGNLTSNIKELNSFGVNRAGTNLYPRRAILRVGMLLRDSEVAKEVRNQLLNIEEKATEGVKVTDINEEAHDFSVCV